MLFLRLSIQFSLSVKLIHSHLPPATVSFFTSEVTIFLGFFYFVHGGSIREILNLTRWNAFFLLHSFDRVCHADVLLNTELLKIFLEVRYTVAHLVSCFDQFSIDFVFVNIDLAILKVFYFFDCLSSPFLVKLPLLFTFLHPLFHESLIFKQLRLL